MFGDLQRYPWVLPIVRYESEDHLLGILADEIVTPALEKADELRPPSPN